jgi:hypothetical protein
MEDEQIIAFSAETNQGRDELAESLMALVAMPSWRGDVAADDVIDVVEDASPTAPPDAPASNEP